jgi:hypothetical protein
MSELALSRRALLASAALAPLSGHAWAQGTASLDDDGFLALSKAVTGHDTLHATTAKRMFALFRAGDPGFAAKAASLWQLHGQAGDPDRLLAAADAQGLKDTMLALVSGWYTGTVGMGENARMVSYADALMYQPVADALTIPTYCTSGPAWWTQAPPPVGVSPPKPEAPKPPPPPATPAEAPKSAQP